MSNARLRIEALAARLHGIYPERTPYENLDEFSKGIADFANDLHTLDAQGKEALRAALDQGTGKVSLEDVELMIQAFPAHR